MVKKVAAILLGVILVLTGCSMAKETLRTVNNDVTEEKEVITELNDISEIVKNNVTEEKETISELNNDNSVEYIGSAMLENLSAFSEGRALVQFRDSAGGGFQGSNRVALIDAQGKILWKSELSSASTVFQHVAGFDGFRDGLVCFVFNGNEKSSYIIIDSDGSVTYTKDSTEDFMILGFGGGLFLTAEHIVNFDTNEWQIGTIDKYGNTVAAYKAYVMDAPPSEPSFVESPPDYSSELEEISNTLSQLEMEHQAWIEECWDYHGETDAQYYKMQEEKSAEYQNKREELLEESQKLKTEYYEKLEKYEEYQQELARYEENRYYYTPRKISFGKNSGEADYYLSCEYLGENIYKLNFQYGFVVLNMDMQDIISLRDHSADTGYIERFITGFEDGAVTVLYNEPTDMEAAAKEAVNLAYFPANLCSVCRMETDGTLTPIVSNIWSKYVLPNILGRFDTFCEGLLFVPYGRGDEMTVYIDKEYYAMTGDSASAYENGFTFYKGVYYNIEGEVAIDFPEYRGKHEYACSPFYNGYALITIKGTDGLPYFTIIDKEGNFRFELKAGFEDAYISEDGKYLLALNGGSLTVFDVNGNPLTRIDTMKITPDTGDYFAGYNTIGFDMREGVIRFGPKGFYVNVEDGTIIGSTYMTADDLSVTKY